MGEKKVNLESKQNDEGAHPDHDPFKPAPDDINLKEHLRPVEAPKPEIPAPDDDPLVLENSRVTDNYVGQVVTTLQPSPKLHSRPKKETWFRTHPDEAHHPEIFAVEDSRSVDKKLYLVSPSLREALAPYIVEKKLYRCIDNSGVEFYFLARPIGIQGELDNWNQGKHLAAEKAKTQWTQLVTNRGRNGYDVKTATDPNAPEPHWSDQSPEELFKSLFQDRKIVSLDHPFAKYLLGEQIG